MDAGPAEMAGSTIILGNERMPQFGIDLEHSHRRHGKDDGNLD